MNEEAQIELDEEDSEEKKKPKREFKGIWMSAWLWTHPDLSCFEKMLLAEIDSLSSKKKKRGCYASNGYLGKHFNTTAGTVAVALSKLRKMRLVENKGFDGRTREICVVFPPSSL